MITSVGATSSTPSTCAMRCARDSCITALEKAKKMDELGGCTRISAPTPSTRLPHSETTPEVSPTTSRTRTTWIEMATMLKPLRRGRTVRLLQTIFNGEKPLADFCGTRALTARYFSTSHASRSKPCTCADFAERRCLQMREFPRELCGASPGLPRVCPQWFPRRVKIVIFLTQLV